MVQSSLAPKKVTKDELNSLVDRAADLIRDCCGLQVHSCVAVFEEVE